MAIAAASVGAHLALLAFVALSIPAAPRLQASPTMIVSLAPRITPQKAAPKPPPRPAKVHVAAPASAVAGPPPPALVPAPSSPAPPPPNDARAAEEESAVRGALQALVVCPHLDNFTIEPAEREKCRHLNRTVGAGGPQYVMDPAAQARHGPPVASHGWAAVMGPPPPRPGILSDPTYCGPGGCPH